MLTKYTLYAAAWLFSITTIYHSYLSGETFNGPTALHHKTFEDLTINGPASLEDVTATTLTVHGPMKFKNLTVTGDTTIEGPVKGRKATFGSLTIHGPFKAWDITVGALNVSGPVKLDHFTIKQPAVIRGPLKAINGEFQDLTVGRATPLHVGRPMHVMLHNVKLKNIVIKGGEVLLLSGKTSISGGVDFDSKHGKLIKKGDEIEVTGKVIGVEAQQ